MAANYKHKTYLIKIITFDSPCPFYVYKNSAAVYFLSVGVFVRSWYFKTTNQYFGAVGKTNKS